MGTNGEKLGGGGGSGQARWGSGGWRWEGDGMGWGRAGVGSRGGMRTRHREDLSIDAGKGTWRGEASMVGAGREYELHENIHDHAKTTKNIYFR
jgi:hypothetical protein